MRESKVEREEGKNDSLKLFRFQGKRTAALVSQLLSCCFEADARRELEIFSLQLLHRPLEFSACGLFSLDRNLITSIAGVITTYLVILVQY